MPHGEHPRKETLQYQNQNHRVYQTFCRKQTHLQYKSKNAASVSEELALFNGSSGGKFD